MERCDVRIRIEKNQNYLQHHLEGGKGGGKGEGSSIHHGKGINDTNGGGRELGLDEHQHQHSTGNTNQVLEHGHGRDDQHQQRDLDHCAASASPPQPQQNMSKHVSTTTSTPLDHSKTSTNVSQTPLDHSQTCLNVYPGLPKHRRPIPQQNQSSGKIFPLDNNNACFSEFHRWVFLKSHISSVIILNRRQYEG